MFGTDSPVPHSHSPSSVIFQTSTFTDEEIEVLQYTCQQFVRWIHQPGHEEVERILQQRITEARVVLAQKPDTDVPLHALRDLLQPPVQVRASKKILQKLKAARRDRKVLVANLAALRDRQARTELELETAMKNLNGKNFAEKRLQSQEQSVSMLRATLKRKEGEWLERDQDATKTILTWQLLCGVALLLLVWESYSNSGVSL